MQQYAQDSPFSWVVAFSCLWIYGVIYGLVRLSGVMLVASIPRYDVGREAASFPYILVNFTKYLTGVAVGLLANRFGVRPVMMIAIVVAAIGVAGCFWAESILTVAIFWGLLFGTGSSCVSLLPALINYSFNKYRSIASGLSKCGIPLGSFIMPLVVDALLKEYELSGTFLVLSGFVLNCLPAALFLECPKYVAKALKPVTDPSCDVVYAIPERQPLISRKTTLYKNVYNSMSADRVFPFPENPNRYYNVGISKDFHHIKSSVVLRDSTERGKETFSASLDSRKAFDRSDDQAPYMSIDFSAKGVNERSERTSTQTNTKSDHRLRSASKNGPPSSVDSSEPTGVKTDRKTLKDSNVEENVHQNHISQKTSCQKTESDLKESKSRNSSREVLKENAHQNHNLQETKRNGETAYCEQKSRRGSMGSVHLACDPLFMLCIFSAPFAAFVSSAMYAIVVDFSQDLGVAAEYGKYTVMSISGGEIAGHLVIGMLSDGRLMLNTTFLVLCNASLAAVTIAVAWSVGFSALMASLFFFGFFASGYSVIVPLVLGDFIEHEKQMLAIASNALLAGPATLAITPLIGFFREKIGSYEYFFYVISLSAFLCGILWLAIHFISKRRKKYRFLI